MHIPQEMLADDFFRYRNGMVANKKYILLHRDQWIFVASSGAIGIIFGLGFTGIGIGLIQNFKYLAWGLASLGTSFAIAWCTRGLLYLQVQWIIQHIDTNCARMDHKQLLMEGLKQSLKFRHRMTEQFVRFGTYPMSLIMLATGYGLIGISML